MALEHCERGGGVVLSVGIKPRPVRTLCREPACAVAWGPTLNSLRMSAVWQGACNAAMLPL